MEQEIRFALVMYGGASLAVYINGVTQEFLRLVRGADPVYRELSEIAQTRFVIDIASGTSAGGINAIFLGKALANGKPLDALRETWLEEADVSKLWNRAARPKSLLSGPTLFDNLMRALSSMDGSATGQEVDVFITATDVHGVDLPIPLTRSTIREKRHKTVFHLRDFSAAMNPFLAFAARATSAFPFVFEHMRLTDAGEIPKARQFFRDYTGTDFSDRPFADGGELDNKPFSHAVSALAQRITDVPARRILAYIEPDPDAHTGLTTQTIREDLQRVLDRNRLIDRVHEVTDQVDRDVEQWTATRRSGADYVRRTLAEEIHERGPAYGGYHRLKVRAVMEHLAEFVSPLPAIESETAFLLHYDLGYRQRRVRFLLAKCGQPEIRRELSRITRTLADFDRRLHECPVALGSIQQEFFAVTRTAAKDLETCIAGDPCLQRYLDRYEYYDQVLFPILYETNVGPPEHVEVFRISPRRKLAGTALFHFGAFLDRTWRAHDMLQGRLDGAEQIISAILPPESADAARLIERIHRSIAAEESAALPRPLDLKKKLSLLTRSAWIALRMLPLALRPPPPL
jgi:predicted acylesterase/phospholipase RssA